MKPLAIVVGVVLVVVALAFGAGAYDVSATRQHWAPTYWLLDVVARQSVRLRARTLDVPPLGDAQQVSRGFALFRRHCVQCHGAPGLAPEAFALGMSPAPANLVHTAREWPPSEVFWVVKEGFKMTGMPAWKHRLADDDIWAIVAFMRELPALSPQAYRARTEGPVVATPPAFASAPDPERGKLAIGQYACATCHVIPGIVGANAPVGPPLRNIGRREMIAGVLPNHPDAMVRWLRDPQSVNPRSAMPDLGVTERDARDIAAYLGTLR